MKDLDIEMLEYGDKVELANGDEYVYVCRALDEYENTILKSYELVLINIFTGKEIFINLYDNRLRHCSDAEFNIVKFTN